MEIGSHISIDPEVHHGVPVITGTRVPVSIVLGSLAGGMSADEVCLEYEITKEDIEAALAYAAELVSTIEVIPIAGA